MNDYRLVAVGTDGSPSAERAVVRAAEVAADAGARLIVICAYEAAGPTAGDGAGPGREVAFVLGVTPAERALASAVDLARGAGVAEVDTVAVEGDPTGALCDEVDRRGADVVVVGNKGLASFAGRLLGSVPAGVSRRSTTDVLIVHTT